jgi:hypothetical protein
LNNKTLVAALVALLALAGCASEPPEPPPQRAAGMKCTKETPTGSHIPVTRCRSAAQIAAEEEEARATGDSIDRSGRSGVRGPTTR